MTVANASSLRKHMGKLDFAGAGKANGRIQKFFMLDCNGWKKERLAPPVLQCELKFALKSMDRASRGRLGQWGLVLLGVVFSHCTLHTRTHFYSIAITAAAVAAAARLWPPNKST